MTVGHLCVSFWHIGLENLPEGTFLHRRLTTEEARSAIEEARATGTLSGASHDDLFAPYRKRERRNHEELRRVLREHHGITLSLEDFVFKAESEDDEMCSILPLQLVGIEGSMRLMVVSCHYMFGKSRGKDGLKFDVAPDSVTFHLFEAMGTTSNGV